MSEKLKSEVSQSGGASGDGYKWHRANAFDNLQKKNGIEKRNQWINEVRQIIKEKNVTWREALVLASNARKSLNPNYATVKETVIAGYTGRKGADGEKVPTTTYRPLRHENKRILTEKAAKKLLKEYYRDKGMKIGDMKKAEQSMKSDISKRRAKPLEGCKTVEIKDSLNRTRNIAVKTEKCADSWLYRKPYKYDMINVDYGNSDSHLYNEKLKQIKYRKTAF